MSGALGRREPTDYEHVEVYPLTFAVMPSKPVPVVLGVNWYTAFDKPTQDSKGRWWLPSDNLGRVRGGHAICVKPGQLTDPLSWWDFYDQGREGACVGFSASRMLSLWNRVRYDARWLYHEAQLVDEYADTPPASGTSVRAAFEILRVRGAKRQASGLVVPGDGISAYRWAQSVEEVHAVIRTPLADSLGAVPLLNSWGRVYPHVVWMPDTVLERLLREGGEAGLATDR